ncbi:MAG: gamma-butyrobetaine hydroxylase-like domain-containing protein [Caulobacteraceae bacterium]
MKITAINPVGRYAVRLVFDDGHDTGLYSWDLMRELGAGRDRLWFDYTAALEKAGLAR